MGGGLRHLFYHQDKIQLTHPFAKYGLFTMLHTKWILWVQCSETRTQHIFVFFFCNHHAVARENSLWMLLLLLMFLVCASKMLNRVHMSPIYYIRIMCHCIRIIHMLSRCVVWHTACVCDDSSKFLCSWWEMERHPMGAFLIYGMKGVDATRTHTRTYLLTIIWSILHSRFSCISHGCMFSA